MEAVAIPLGVVADLAVVAVDPVTVGVTVPEETERTQVVTDPVRRALVLVALLLLVVALLGLQIITAMRKKVLMPEPLTREAPPTSGGKVTALSSLGRRRIP